VCFAVVAGPYVAALSIQRGRFRTLATRARLNYACTSAARRRCTYQLTRRTVRLRRGRPPNIRKKDCCTSPLILSYPEMPLPGTYPDWFDTDLLERPDQSRTSGWGTTFPLRAQIGRAGGRYLFNPPRGATADGVAWLVLGAEGHLWRHAHISKARYGATPADGYMGCAAVSGAGAIWGIYALVTTEEPTSRSRFQHTSDAVSALRQPDAPMKRKRVAAGSRLEGFTSPPRP